VREKRKASTESPFEKIPFGVQSRKVAATSKWLWEPRKNENTKTKKKIKVLRNGLQAKKDPPDIEKKNTKKAD